MTGEGKAGALYRRLTGSHPGEGGLEFVRNLTWIGASFALAKVLSALVNIAAGRLLGPEEYGRITILVSAGAALSPFMVAGLNNSVVRYGVAPGSRNSVFTAGALVFMSAAAAVLLCVTLLLEPLSSALGIPPGMLALARWYALASGAFTLTSAMMQASGRFPHRGLGEIAFSVILAAAFWFGLGVSGKTYQAMAWAYIAAFGTVALFWLAALVRRTRAALPEARLFSEMSRYGAYSFGGGLGYYLTLSVQGLVLNAFLAPSEVGIYAAYSTATLGIAAHAGYAIGTVLFPKAAASTNCARLWDLAARGWTRLAPAAVVLFLAAEAAILLLMGSEQYALRPRTMLLFSVCGTLMLVHSSLAQIVFSEGVKASRLSLYMSWGGGIFNFAACLALVPALGVDGAALSFAATYALLLFWLFRVKDGYLSGAGKTC